MTKDDAIKRSAKHVMMSAHALCPTEQSHPDKMAWIAEYFLANYRATAHIEQGEAVAYMTADKRMMIFADALRGNLDSNTDGMTPLYTHPAPVEAQPVAWINRTDKMPDESQLILAAYDSGIELIWFRSGYQNADAMRYWMPAPLPPTFTTAPTPAPAAGSIGDDAEFMNRLDVYGQAINECESGGYYAETIARKNAARTALVELIDARSQPAAAPEGWIDVNIKIPEPEIPVLCTDGILIFVDWFGSKRDCGRGVTHWQPLPPPPGSQPLAAPSVDIERVRALHAKLEQWRACMSYNDSYFGEPAGLVKSVVRELDHLLNPGAYGKPVAAAPQPPAQQSDAGLSKALKACTPEEMRAFEKWAASEGYGMEQHPLHYLFLNRKTYTARQGWKAGLYFAEQAIIARISGKGAM